MTKAKFKRRLKAVVAGIRRRGLNNTTFSILSNNCWGGMIYDVYGLQYRTPTIGLWIPAHDYVKFLENIEFYLKQDLVQISYQESHVAELLIQRKKEGQYKQPLEDFVIGRCHDIDIVFLHYHKFDEARDKWNRRKMRINWDNLIVKFNDQNGFTIDDYESFKRLQFKHKILITANPDLKDKADVVYLEKYKDDGFVLDDTKLELMPFDIKQYLNTIAK